MKNFLFWFAGMVAAGWNLVRTGCGSLVQKVADPCTSLMKKADKWVKCYLTAVEEFMLKSCYAASLGSNMQAYIYRPREYIATWKVYKISAKSKKVYHVKKSWRALL